jgi:glycogen(starch) synthase
MAGVAVPRIAHNKWPITTIFTTHATMLGRYLASDSAQFYSHLPYIKPDEEAAKYQIWSKFAIERAAAHASTVFTTMSEVTAYRSGKTARAKADVILPNGLNIQRFARALRIPEPASDVQGKIHEFVMGHFFRPTFDLDNTLYFITSSRYEYRNKGMDL